MEEEKTVRCVNCHKELSGNDPVFVDNEDCPYCSKGCLIADSCLKIITAQKYIEEDEEWGR